MRRGRMFTPRLDEVLLCLLILVLVHARGGLRLELRLSILIVVHWRSVLGSGLGCRRTILFGLDVLVLMISVAIRIRRVSAGGRSVSIATARRLGATAPA